MNAPEYKLLTDNYPAILTGLKSDPVAVTDQLESSRILPPRVSEYVGNPYHSKADKARNLLKAVEDQVEIAPQVIHIFYKALRKAGAGNHGLKTIADLLESEMTTRGIKQSSSPDTTGSTNSEYAFEVLKKELKLTDSQLSQKIEQKDIPFIAGCVDSIDPYPDALELSGGEKTDVTKAEAGSGTRTAMGKCLSMWKSHRPSRTAPTFKDLLDIMFGLERETDAEKVMEYIARR